MIEKQTEEAKSFALPRRFTPSQVLIQPFDVTIPSPDSHREVGRPACENHTTMEAILKVVQGHVHTCTLQALGVQDPVIPQDIMLTGEDVGLWEVLKHFLVCDERGGSCIQQLRDLLGDPGITRGLHDRLVALFDGWGQQGCPVETGPESCGLLHIKGSVIVHNHGLHEVIVALEVIYPVLHHDVAWQDGSVRVLLIRGRVEIQSLENWVD